MSDSVEQLLRRHYVTYRPLTDLLGADRFFTLRVPPLDEDGVPVERGDVPYLALLSGPDGDIRAASSGIDLISKTYVFSLWHFNLSKAKQLIDTLEERFRRPTIRGDGLTIHDVKRQDREETDAGGMYNIDVTFLVRTATHG